MNEPKPLKLFSCTHDGKYVFGMSVVIATSKPAAKKLLITKLLEMQVNNDVLGNSIEIEELDMSKPSVYVLFDGVY